MPPCEAAEGGEKWVWEKELSTNSPLVSVVPTLGMAQQHQNPKLNAHGKQSKMASADSLSRITLIQPLTTCLLDINNLITLIAQTWRKLYFDVSS